MALTVNPVVVAPTITTYPADQSVVAGSSASFSVVATGSAPLSYQWHLDNVNAGTSLCQLHKHFHNRRRQSHGDGDGVECRRERDQQSGDPDGDRRAGGPIHHHPAVRAVGDGG